MNEEAIFRSADMSFIEIYIPADIARDVVNVLGDLGNIQIADCNKDTSAFQRTFVKEIRKLDECERQLAYLTLLMHKHSTHVAEQEVPKVNTSTTTMETIMGEIGTSEERVERLETSYETLVQRRDELVRHRHVLNASRRFFDNRASVEFVRDSLDFSLDESLDLENPRLNSQDAGLEIFNDSNFVVGYIATSKLPLLNKICWRTLRGNLYFDHVEVEEELSVFIVFTHGEVLLQKVRKIVDSLDGKVYRVSTAYDVYHEELNTLNTQIDDLAQLLDTTSQTLETELLLVADQISLCKATTRREKLVYATLNLFESYGRSFRLEGWTPTSELPLVTNELRDVCERTGSESQAVLNVMHTNKTPPTYHRTNKFSSAFQSITDAYGVATYKEVNPALATIVTFPFMFAIMFGDLGHGFIVLLCGLYLVLNERKMAGTRMNEILQMAFDGRYVILLMGAFSMYTGFIYNDIFSRSMTLFKSGWEWPTNFEMGQTVEATRVGVYSFGIDFAWHGTENNLLFTNSLKMKMSILMGFIHMSYSFLFSLVNYVYRGSKVDIWGNFIPGLIFMQSIFGYLSVCIVYKWTQSWTEASPPGLLNMLISMFLTPGTVEEHLYWGQSMVQVVLLLAALVCVPWLLLYKPLVLRWQNNNAQKAGYMNLHHQNTSQTMFELEEDAGSELIITDMSHHEEFNMGDIVIHQVIHTIEFCLNCVSHTASYLRLWALSLAHAQLSTVLWQMVFQNFISLSTSYSTSTGAFLVMAGFFIWFCLTVAILVLMEGTSAMLHSLRLHWVEAMSKFFEGEGYAFQPFSFITMLQELDALEEAT